MTLKEGDFGAGPVVYWMSRDQRAVDNWALLYAQDLALELEAPLYVVFNLVPKYLQATIRQYGFMLKGLKQVEKELKKYNIPMFLLLGQPKQTVPEFVAKNKAAALVTDFNPLRTNRNWTEKVCQAVRVPVYEVDAHNIVPARIVSEKQEYAAYTIRPKINKLLNKFLVDIPRIEKHPYKEIENINHIDWINALNALEVDRSVGGVDLFEPGTSVGMHIFDDFLVNKLENYREKRNLPTEDFQSNLSPYLHFGQLSAQRIALEVLNRSDSYPGQEAFLEQLIIRRELSDNYCFYNDNYDNYNGFPDWAHKSLDEHLHDPRPYLYSLEQLEHGQTHDKLWNAAQAEMVRFGKMHGYLRMYWAKKILEWTISAEQAQEFAVYLNDRYELDGRDPNGYAGIAWSIGGVHDLPWFEREIFGKIRYMSFNGAMRKFDVPAYIASMIELVESV